MDKAALRPIGTEFEIVYPPAVDSTNPYSHVARYRIVAHELALRFPGDKVGTWAETLKAVAYHPVQEGA